MPRRLAALLAELERYEAEGHGEGLAAEVARLKADDLRSFLARVLRRQPFVETPSNYS